MEPLQFPTKFRSHSDATLDEGNPFAVSGSFTDAGTDTWTATVDYSDGTGPQPLALNADQTFALSHVYPDDGVYTVTVTVSDDDAGVGTDSLTVTVVNTAPVVTAGPDAALDEGNPFAANGSFTDAGTDTWTATVDYGDGAGPQPLPLNPDQTFALGHVYPDDGVYTVTVTVSDDDGGVGTDSLTVTVVNTAPLVTVGPDATLDEGGALASNGAFTDAGTDTWTATVDYSDGAGPQLLALNADQTFALGHVYPDDGAYTVTVTVSDDDGGVGTDSLTVTVVNTAPVVTAGPDAALDEGNPFAVSGSFTDAGTDTWTATVDYSDGTGPQPLPLNADQTFALSHVYPDDGVYTVTVTVSDDDGGVGTDSLTVTVVNTAPVVTAGPDATLDEGNPFAANGSFTDAGTDTWTATVDYGDGAGPQPLVLNSDQTFALGHVYPDDGAYTVTVTVSDDDGGVGTDSLTVTVVNTAPVVTAGPDAALDEGGALASNGAFTDAGTDTWTATVDYSDGTGPQPLPLNADQTFALSHVYPDDGVYTVTVTVSDDDGGVGTDSLTVTVVNTAPVVTAGPDATLDEGNPFAVSGSFTDAGADTWTATVDYGDGAGPQPLVLNSDQTFALSHVYPDDGAYTVTVTVRDDDGGVGTDSLTVTVVNTAPLVTAGPDAALDEGNPFAAGGSFTDAGADTWTATVDYGDGAGPQPLPLNPDQTFALSHVYPDDGVYTVTVTVSDDDGGVGTDTLEVEVSSSPPVVTGLHATPMPVDEGSVTLLSATFTDSDATDTHAVYWDLGDGSTLSTDLEPSGIRDSALPHTYADDGSFMVRVAVTDREGHSGTGEVRVDVLNVPPAFDPPLSDHVVAEGMTLTVAVSAVDASSVDVVSVTATGLPARAEFAGESQTGRVTGVLTWTPACDQAGEYSVTFTAADDDGGVTEETVTVTVTDACVGVVAVVNNGDNTVTLIDAGTNQVTATYAVGLKPVGVSLYGLSNDAEATQFDAGIPPARLYVTDRGHGEVGGAYANGVVRVFTGPMSPEPATAQAFTLYNNIEVGKRPEAIALSPDGAQVWVANWNDNTITIADRATDYVIATVPLQLPSVSKGKDSRGDSDAGRGSLVVGRRPTAIGFSPDGMFAFITARNSDSFVVVRRDLATTDPTHAIVAVLEVGKHPEALTVDSAGQLAYIAMRDGVALVDVSRPLAPALMGVLPVTGHLRGIALSPDGRKVYASNDASDTVTVLDVQPAPVYLSYRTDIGVGRGPAGLAVAPAGGAAAGARVYVASEKDHVVAVIDIETDRVIATVPVGAAPVSVAVGMMPTRLR